eukprot:2260059-Pleurochrysis_carterae.AAC.1
MPISEIAHNPLPKSWHVIIGGPFEGVRFSNYKRDLCQHVERYADCRAYGPGAGIDEATATKRLREARKQRVRDARDTQKVMTLTPAPAPRPKPASAPAKPATAH